MPNYFQRKRHESDLCSSFSRKAECLALQLAGSVFEFANLCARIIGDHYGYYDLANWQFEHGGLRIVL